MANDKKNWGSYTIREKADTPAGHANASDSEDGAGGTFIVWSVILALVGLLGFGGVSCVKYFIDTALAKQERQLEAARNRPKRIPVPVGLVTLTVGQQWSDQYVGQARYLNFRSATGPFVANDGRNEVSYEPRPDGGVRKISGSSSITTTMQFRCLSCGTSNITLTIEATNSRKPSSR